MAYEARHVPKTMPSVDLALASRNICARNSVSRIKPRAGNDMGRNIEHNNKRTPKPPKAGDRSAGTRLTSMTRLAARENTSSERPTVLKPWIFSLGFLALD